jgi:putative DNA primase/helicase
MADETPRSNTTERAENSIRPSKKRRQEGTVQATAAAPSAESRPAKPNHAVPEDVRRQFVQVKNKYYFPDGARAFTDRGTRLTTGSENTEVVRSLLLIAEARGWSEVTVRGTERFRREAWFAAQMMGIEVRGYKPTEFERGRVVRALHRQGPAPTEEGVAPGETPAPAESDRRPRRREELLSGRLVDHGVATYRHDPHEPMSYFVNLETARGERTIWGVDLERAFKESLTKPEIGDEVGLRAVRQEAVKVRTQKRDEKGGLIERELDTHRNRWIVGVSRRRTRLQVGESPTEVKRLRPRSVGGTVAREPSGGALRHHALERSVREAPGCKSNERRSSLVTRFPVAETVDNVRRQQEPSSEESYAAVFTGGVSAATGCE